jgi:hypothetical protein
MNRCLRGILFGAALVSALTTAWAEDIKPGLEDRIGGPFQLKAITGDNKGKQLCYV